MQSDAVNLKRASLADTTIMILVLGSLWGFSEVVLSNAIQASGIAFRAGILAGIGMGIMGIALGFNRKVLPLIGIALVTILAKQLVVPVLQCSVLCKANSCAAVFLQGGALCGVAAIAGQKLHSAQPARLITPISAALVSAGAFYFIGMGLAPCPYLLSFNHSGGLLSFMAIEGLAWAAFSTILFPAGYTIGLVLKNTLPEMKTAKPVTYYITAVTALICCYTAITISIMNSSI